VVVVVMWWQVRVYLVVQCALHGLPSRLLDPAVPRGEAGRQALLSC
jgi:hypothetical protein